MTSIIQDVDSLLLSKRIEHVTHDPFCFFYVDDYLPVALYESLLESFPAESNYDYTDDGKLGFRSSVEPNAVARFAAEHPAWQALIDFFCSDVFLNDARKTFEEDLIVARGLAGRRRWINCNRREAPGNWLRYQLEEPMRSTFQFSLLPSDAAVVPHADAPRKLISLLLYFRDPEWQDAYGGGTEFYVPLDARRARRWSHTQRIPFEEFKSIGESAFEGNRLATAVPRVRKSRSR